MLSTKTNFLLNEYANLIFETNQKFNLTGFKNRKDIYQNLILDIQPSLLNIEFDLLKIKNVIDIGSGNGCPGIILGILKPNLNITLIESNNKKSIFLIEVVKKLNLNNIKVICSRAEDLDTKIYTEKFDLGISRAVASISIMNELLCRWIKMKKYICHFKSINFENELKEAKKNLKNLGLKFYEKKEIKGLEKFNINIFFQKIEKTNSKYPRTWNQIKND